MLPENQLYFMLFLVSAIDFLVKLQALSAEWVDSWLTDLLRFTQIFSAQSEKSESILFFPVFRVLPSSEILGIES